jgi:hypothetical protein
LPEARFWESARIDPYQVIRNPYRSLIHRAVSRVTELVVVFFADREKDGPVVAVASAGGIVLGLAEWPLAPQQVERRTHARLAFAHHGSRLDAGRVNVRNPARRASHSR